MCMSEQTLRCHKTSCIASQYKSVGGGASHSSVFPTRWRPSLYSICFTFLIFSIRLCHMRYEVYSISRKKGYRFPAKKSTTTLFVCLASVFSVDAWFAPNHLYSHQEEELCRVWNFLNFLSSTPLDLGGGGGITLSEGCVYFITCILWWIQLQYSSNDKGFDTQPYCKILCIAL